MKKLLLIVLLGVAISLHAQDEYDRMEYVKGDILVMVDDSKNIDQLVADLQIVNHIETDLEAVREIGRQMNIWRLTFDHTAIAHQDLLNAFWQHEHVLLAQNNHLIENREMPNDPNYSSQWHHDNIDSEAAWDITTGGETANGDEIVVCVIEGGGANYGHTDLTDNHWQNEDEINGNGIDDDGNGYIDDLNGWNTQANNDAVAGGNHGTGVSGMAGAKGDNGTGVSGANWDVKIMQVDMAGISESNVIEAYDYPLTMRKMYNASGGTEGAFVVVTNASWGIDYGDPDSAPMWCAYYDTLGAHGILNCGATTNSALNVDAVGDLPTACPSDYMVSVTATNTSDVRTFSGYGATTIDLGAPGQNVYTTENGGYGSTSGTSFASPLTAGVIALLYSAPCEALADLALVNPWQAADKVRQALFDGTDPVSSLSGECVTGGRLNSKNAIDELMLSCNDHLSVDEAQESVNFEIYPNPATTEINLVTYNDDQLTFRIYDSVGRLLQEVQVSGLTTIDVSALSAGVYMYAVENNTNGMISTDKFIVE